MRKLKLFVFMVLAFFFIGCRNVYAVEDNSSEYTITDYDVNIIVNENNVLDITETITANFLVPKHGIYRTIPTRNTVVRNDGSKSSNRAVISDINVDNKFYVGQDSYSYTIRIGDADYTMTGINTYTITYKYNLGKDPFKDIDEFYFNVIGTEWDTKISDVDISVIMPKDIDESKLGLSIGQRGTVGSYNTLQYNKELREIKVDYDGTLLPGEGITIRAELPEGYFQNAGIPEFKWKVLIFVIPLVGLFISLLLWFVFGKDDKVIDTVEFNPPDGVNSLELGFLYRGYADSSDVVSLLIFLANKGYIKIKEKKNDNFEIIKIKDYDGQDENEKMFLDGLYEFGELKKDEHGNKILVIKSQKLEDEFYKVVNKISSNMNKRSNKAKIWVNNSLYRFIIAMLMLLGIFSLIVIPAMDYGLLENLIVFAPILIFLAMPVIIIGISTVVKNESPILCVITIVNGFIGVVFLASPLLMQQYNMLDSYYKTGIKVGIICIIGMFILSVIISKRNENGNKILGRIKGFKRFLKTAEKERLEAMVEKNPTYFYDILPYAYVLGVSNIWIEKFETIATKAPSWYDGTTDFNMISFGSFMDSAMSDVSSSPNSGSSFDGGGSSGGGSGGGGGGSW